MAAPSPARIRFLKGVVFALCLLPALRLAWRAAHGGLGANPIEVVTRAAGWWTLALLLITLSVTPLRRLAGAPWLLRFRRMLGLFAFAYALTHLGLYVWLDQFFDAMAILEDILKRPFITVGMLAMTMLIPLAATSTDGMVRRLGARRWQALHRLVYVIVPLGVLHYWWLVKRDVTQPAIFLGLAVLLLAYRAVVAARGLRTAGSPVRTPQVRESRAIAGQTRS